MKAASFVIGILVGMVLLVVAVGGGLAVALSVVSVGQIEDTVGTDIIDDASDANNSTLLDLATDLIKDFGDPSSLTINLFREKYGLKIPAEISGIDISVLFDYPISEVANHLGDVVNNMTLRDVDEFLSLGLEEKYPDLSVLISNLDNNVDDALNNILASIDSSSMTLYSLETGFGITLGENRLFDELYHTPLSEFGEVMDLLPVGTLTGADSDLFLPIGENKVFVAVDRYEEVTGNELEVEKDEDGEETYIAETYIAGADEKGLIRRELRYTRGEDGSYTPDNSCYAEDYDGTGTFYRHVTYERYDGTQDGELFVKAYLNNFTADGKELVLVADGLFPLSSVYTDESLSVSLAKKVTDGKVTVGEGLFINIAAEGEAPSPAPAALFGLPEGATKDENSRLEEQKADTSYSMPHIRVHIGTSDQAIQVIAGIGVSSLNNVTDKITSLKLGEVIDITDDSAKILRTLKDTQISKLSDALDTITLKDATDIVLDEYSPATGGAYVLEDGSYTLYNPAKHAGAQRYQKTVVEGSSSAALQRLANVTIPNISAAFDTMVLGDALNVEVDSFAPVREPQNGETYFVFNETLGYPERVVYNAENAAADATYYERTHEGEGNAVLKQLAYVKIDNVSKAMDGIIENTLLSDIIEVTEYTVAQYVPDGTPETDEDQWLFEADPNYTENGKHYTFVYDGSGKYYMTDVVYLPATKSQLTGATTNYFTYQKANFSDLSALYEHLLREPGNLFFSDGSGGYEANPALTAYYLASPGTALEKINGNAYTRVECDASAEGAIEATIYGNVTDAQAQGGLYVKDEGSVTGSTESGYSVTFGGYTLYDAENPAHWGAELYFKYSEGYYPASDGNGTHSFDFTTGSFSEGTGGGYILLEAKYEDGRTGSDGSTPLALYYYSLIDSEYKEGYTVYSKRECDYIFLENKANGGWTNVSGEWEEYNEDIHGTDAARYDRVIGYIGGNAANNGGTGLSPLSKTKVTVIEEKSPTILISLLERQVTIGSLNDTIDTLTIGELMKIEPGSVFDNDVLRNATIENLSEKVSSLFTDMTIGTLLEYANVSVSSEIAYILQDVKISDFFTALEYKDGTITVNMEKLLGVN